MNPMERYTTWNVAHLEQSTPGIRLIGRFGVRTEVILILRGWYSPGDDHYHQQQQE